MCFLSFSLTIALYSFCSQTKKGFCSKFHSLPFAARVAIFSVVALIGIGTLSCCLWVFCCKPPASGKKIDLKDFEDKFEYDGEFEAPALEQKLPIEKQKLVIDAWKYFQELFVKS